MPQTGSAPVRGLDAVSCWCASMLCLLPADGRRTKLLQMPDLHGGVPRADRRHAEADETRGVLTSLTPGSKTMRAGRKSTGKAVAVPAKRWNPMKALRHAA